MRPSPSKRHLPPTRPPARPPANPPGPPKTQPNNSRHPPHPPLFFSPPLFPKIKLAVSCSGCTSCILHSLSSGPSLQEQDLGRRKSSSFVSGWSGLGGRGGWVLGYGLRITKSEGRVNLERCQEGRGVGGWGGERGGKALVERVMISFHKSGLHKGFPRLRHPPTLSHMCRGRHGRQSGSH